MQEIIIKYDSYYSEWINRIRKGLDDHDIINSDIIAPNICRSLSLTVESFLKQYRWRPKNNIAYRINLIEQLSKHGISFSIKSNKLLWKFLEYFTDLEDYSKCFDIELKILDETKAKYYLHNKAIDNLYNSNPYLDIQNKLNKLKNKKEIDSNFILEFLNILEIINKEVFGE